MIDDVMMMMTLMMMMMVVVLMTTMMVGMVVAVFASGKTWPSSSPADMNNRGTTRVVI